MYSLLIRYQTIRPDLCVFVDVTGFNTKQKDDGGVAGGLEAQDM